MRELQDEELRSEQTTLICQRLLTRPQEGKFSFLLSCHSFLIYDILTTDIQYLIPVWKGAESIYRCLFLTGKMSQYYIKFQIIIPVKIKKQNKKNLNSLGMWNIGIDYRNTLGSIKRYLLRYKAKRKTGFLFNHWLEH